MKKLDPLPDASDGADVGPSGSWAVEALRGAVSALEFNCLVLEHSVSPVFAVLARGDASEEVADLMARARSVSAQLEDLCAHGAEFAEESGARGSPGAAAEARSSFRRKLYTAASAHGTAGTSAHFSTSPTLAASRFARPARRPGARASVGAPRSGPGSAGAREAHLIALMQTDGVGLATDMAHPARPRADAEKKKAFTSPHWDEENMVAHEQVVNRFKVAAGKVNFVVKAMAAKDPEPKSAVAKVYEKDTIHGGTGGFFGVVRNFAGPGAASAVASPRVEPAPPVVENGGATETREAVPAVPTGKATLKVFSSAASSRFLQIKKAVAAAKAVAAIKGAPEFDGDGEAAPGERRTVLASLIAAAGGRDPPRNDDAPSKPSLLLDKITGTIIQSRKRAILQRAETDDDPSRSSAHTKMDEAEFDHIVENETSRRTHRDIARELLLEWRVFWVTLFWCTNGYVIVLAPLFAALGTLSHGLPPAWHAANCAVEVANCAEVFARAARRALDQPGGNGWDRADAALALPAWIAWAALGNVASGRARVALRTATVSLKLAAGIRLFQKNVTLDEDRRLNATARALDLDPILVRIGKLAFAFLIVIHYVCCAYNVVGRRHSSRTHRALGGWAYYANHGDRGDVFAQWAQSYFWAAASILGNYTLPGNASQAIFNVVVFLLGLAMTATMTGSITSLLANADVSLTRQREQISQIRKYMQANQVPEDLAMTVRGYYEYVMETNHHDDALFSDLTDSLKLRLNIATKRRFIQSCIIFHHLDQYSIIRLILRLRQVICVPDEVVVAQGEIGASMYFIANGKLVASCATSNGGFVNLGVIEAGSHFGEAAILEPDGRRNATVRAMTFGELYHLKFDELFEAGDEDRAVLEAITRDVHARRIVRDLSSKLKRARVVLMAFTHFAISMKSIRRRNTKGGPANASRGYWKRKSSNDSAIDEDTSVQDF